MQKIFRWIFPLLESYIVITLFALGAGLFFSKQTVFLSAWVTPLLQIIFFLSSLKMDGREILVAVRDVRALVVVNLYMLVVLPLIVYGVGLLLVPQYAIALMLLAAMPSAMSAPLFAEIVGLPVSRALVITITTSLLTPLTVPAVVWLLAGTSVQVDPFSIFWSLTQVIVIPFVLAQIVRAVWPAGMHASALAFKPISTLLLGVLMVGVVAPQADAIQHGLTGSLLPVIAVLFLFFIALHILGYYLTFWKNTAERLTISLCLTYMNFTLAIYLAGRFFNTPDVVLPVILSIFPWTLLLMPFRWVARRRCPTCFVDSAGSL